MSASAITSIDNRSPDVNGDSKDESTPSAAQSKAAFQCPQCGHIFTRSHGLKRHIVSVHERQQQFKCHICEKAFTLKSVLVDHLLTHSGAKPFNCSICGEEFKSRRSRSRHQLKFHSSSIGENGNCLDDAQESIERPLKKIKHDSNIGARSTDTTMTPSSSSSSSSTNPSSVDQPTVPQPSLLICGICTLSCRSEELLAYHMHTAHETTVASTLDVESTRTRRFDAESSSDEEEIEQSVDESVSLSSSGESISAPPRKKRPRPTRIFTCPYSDDGCQSTFHYAHVLQNHIRALHTQRDLPFECTVCAKRFLTEPKLLKHQGTHYTIR